MEIHNFPASSGMHCSTCSVWIFGSVLCFILRQMDSPRGWFRRLRISWDHMSKGTPRPGISTWRWRSLQQIILSMWLRGIVHSTSILATTPCTISSHARRGCVEQNRSCADNGWLGWRPPWRKLRPISPSLRVGPNHRWTARGMMRHSR